MSILPKDYLLYQPVLDWEVPFAIWFLIYYLCTCIILFRFCHPETVGYLVAACIPCLLYVVLLIPLLTKSLWYEIYRYRKYFVFDCLIRFLFVALLTTVSYTDLGQYYLGYIFDIQENIDEIKDHLASYRLFTY